MLKRITKVTSLLVAAACNQFGVMLGNTAVDGYKVGSNGT